MQKPNLELWQVLDSMEETDRHFDYKRLQGITIKHNLGRDRDIIMNKKV